MPPARNPVTDVPLDAWGRRCTRKLSDRMCDHCSKTFRPKNRTQRFCSTDCRDTDIGCDFKVPTRRGSLDEEIERNSIPEPNSGCHLWMGGMSSGYGAMYIGRGKSWGAAHRIAFELANGTIPDGMVLDHKCRTPICVNTDHLEIVTRRVNTLRGIGPTAVNATKTCCLQGHPFDLENTYLHRGRRTCRECNRSAARAHYYRKRGRP